MRFRLTVILLLIVMFIVLIAQNTGDASITFLFWSATTTGILRETQASRRRIAVAVLPVWDTDS